MLLTLTNPVHGSTTYSSQKPTISFPWKVHRTVPKYQVLSSVPSPEDFPTGDRFAPRSSHPRFRCSRCILLLRVPGSTIVSPVPDEVSEDWSCANLERSQKGGEVNGYNN